MNQSRPKIKKWHEIPIWKDKTRCPICNSKLVKKWEGLVCTNLCPLNFKCENGWVYIQSKSKWSNSRWAINNSTTKRRNYLQGKFAKLKKDVLIRDDYKCRICDYELKSDFMFDIGLECHHIVPASEEMALYLDIDNLITLCKTCHKNIHEDDKYKFGGKCNDKRSV